MISNVIKYTREIFAENLLWFGRMPEYFVTAERKVVEDTIKQIPLGWFEEHQVGGRAGFNACYPNSKDKAIMYWEDWGMAVDTGMQQMRPGVAQYRHKARLIVIANSSKIQTGIRADQLAGNILYFMPKTFVFEDSIAQSIRCEFNGMTAPGWSNLFARYTLEETEKQFLMHPYIAFGMEFTFVYTINTACNPLTVLTPPRC